MLPHTLTLARMKGATPAVLCLLALLPCLPIFLWHEWRFALLLQQPGLEAMARPAVLAALNRVLLLAIGIDVLLVLWLWPRRRAPEPLPRVAVLVAVVQATAFTAMGVVYGHLTSPLTTVLVTAPVVGLGLLGRRPTLIGFAVAAVLLTVADWLILAGVMPYAPALVPGTFVQGRPVAWWAEWQDLMFYTALILGLSLMMWLFAQLDRQRDLLLALSRTDGLTQLSNRRHFMERLGAETRRRDRYGQPFAVVLCDADHFKRVNDSYGHHVGDEVLRHIGRLLRTGLRIPGDVAARLGGEEFALLLTECSESEARTVCERLCRQLREHVFEADGQRFHVTLSMGMVECRSGSEEEVLKAADLNLYRAKREGRDCVVASLQGVPA